MKMKKRIMGFIAGIAMIAGAVLGVSTPAQAATYMIGQDQLNSACAWSNTGVYKAKSVANNVLGWRCYNTVYPNNTSYYSGVDLQLYCDVKHPGTTAKWYTYSNKWDWRCTTD